MFDVLGVISFLFVIYCLVMLIISMFSRRINRKLWLAVTALGLVVFFSSYALDRKFDKDVPPQIDFTGIEIETPTPEVTETPSPTPTATPSPSPTPEETQMPDDMSEPTPVPTPKPTPEETSAPEAEDMVDE